MWKNTWKVNFQMVRPSNGDFKDCVVLNVVNLHRAKCKPYSKFCDIAVVGESFWKMIWNMNQKSQMFCKPDECLAGLKKVLEALTAAGRLTSSEPVYLQRTWSFCMDKNITCNNSTKAPGQTRFFTMLSHACFQCFLCKAVENCQIVTCAEPLPCSYWGRIQCKGTV